VVIKRISIIATKPGCSIIFCYKANIATIIATSSLGDIAINFALKLQLVGLLKTAAGLSETQTSLKYPRAYAAFNCSGMKPLWTENPLLRNSLPA